MIIGNQFPPILMNELYLNGPTLLVYRIVFPFFEKLDEILFIAKQTKNALMGSQLCFEFFDQETLI